MNIIKLATRSAWKYSRKTFFIIVATSLEYTEEQIFELYRARWQIECVFLRLKSLFGLGEVLSRNEDSVLTWLYGKLFLATLCEAIEKKVMPSLWR